MLSIKCFAKEKLNESMADRHSYWVLRWKQWQRNRRLANMRNYHCLLHMRLYQPLNLSFNAH